MPIYKRNKKLTVKPKKQTYKKTYKKTMAPSYTKKRFTPSNNNKAMTALSTVAIQHNKLLTSLFDRVTYQAISSREWEVSALASGGINPGYCALQFLYSANSNNPTTLPVHIYDLTGITRNDGSTSNFIPGRALRAIGTSNTEHNFSQYTEMPQLYQTSINDGGSFDTAAASYSNNINKSMLNYVDIRLDLYERDKYETEYTVSLMKLSETVSPDYSVDSSKGNTNKIFNSFWYHYSRPLITNTLQPKDVRLTEDLKEESKILWTKKYKLKEKNTLVDSYKAKRVKIFRRINKILKYNETPPLIQTIGDDPTLQILETNLESSGARTSNQTRNKDRLYLVITANNTIDGNAVLDGASTNADVPSYNIFMRTQHSIPSIG